MYYYWAIALTGGIVLGIEVLSSRILTPYFGVSLYIWASILTITLVCLAGGYFYGGMLTRRKTTEEVRAFFSIFLAVASMALALSAALYPHVFPMLMSLHLVLGSLLAAVVLMAVPLVLFSALNSFVIVLAGSDKSKGGDAGAGTVFFISTLGSVLGVVLTAFLVIPLMSNTVGLLSFAVIAALLSFSSVRLCCAGAAQRKRAQVLAAMAVILTLGALAGESLFRQTKFVDEKGVTWNLLEERHSMFGSVKVVDRVSDAGTLRIYFNDGIFQNTVRQDGTSGAPFTYVLSSLLKHYAPDARNILFLGLAAGVVPNDFPASQYHTEIVEINPDSLAVAKRYFGFNDAGRTVHIQDARTFVQGCDGKFDAIVFDMFHGDGVPDYLLTAEFFSQLRRCGTGNGVIVMNLEDDREEPAVRNAILATVHASFSNVGYFVDEGHGGGIRNAFILASNRKLVSTPTGETAPADLAPRINATLASGRLVEPAFYGHAAPLSDDHNVFSVLSAETNMRYRKSIQKILPYSLYRT